MVLTKQFKVPVCAARYVQVCLQVLPFAACSVTVISGFLLMYNVGSPQGTHAFSTTPQGACIILSAAGSAACIVMCLGVPHMSRRLGLRAPEPMKRMSRLGLVSQSMHPAPAGQNTHLNLPLLHCFVRFIILPPLLCMFACTLNLLVTQFLTCWLHDPAVVDHLSLSASLELSFSAAYVCVSLCLSLT